MCLNKVRKYWTCCKYPRVGPTSCDVSWHFPISWFWLVLHCKAKRQYLLTCKISRNCLLALHGRYSPTDRYSRSDTEWAMTTLSNTYNIPLSRAECDNLSLINWERKNTCDTECDSRIWFYLPCLKWTAVWCYLKRLHWWPILYWRSLIFISGYLHYLLHKCAIY